MVDPANPLEGLTRRQLQGLHNLLSDVHSSLAWSWQLPVLIRQRCWLRLEMIELGNLHRWLPPDGCEEAPELCRYRELVAQGWSPLQAQEQCWQEFGDDDCRTALQRFWASQHDRKHDWTVPAISGLDQLLSALNRSGCGHHPDAGAAPSRGSDRSSAALGFGQHTVDAAHLRLIPGHGP